MKTPIVIIATARTGSTAFGSAMARRLNLPFFSEPFLMHNDRFRIPSYDNHMRMLERFKKTYRSNSSDYVLKIMMGDINDTTPYAKIVKDAYLIRMRRRDVVAQIASFYVAETRNIWHNWGDEKENYEIKIDDTALRSCFERITRMNWMITHSSLNFDMTVFYEDLGFISNSDYHVMPKPSNIEELHQAIRNMFWKD